MKWRAPFFNENQNKEDFTMKIFEKKNNLQELEKKTSVVCDDRHAGSNTFVRRHEKCRGQQGV